MRQEKYYSAFDYGDDIYPGVSVKLEHNISIDYADEKPDLTPFIGLGRGVLTKARDASIEAEKSIFERIKASIGEWERQAAVTKTYGRALDYINTPKVSHTSNQWTRNDYRDCETISNMVYEMNVSVWEDTKYDRATDTHIPVAWYVTWNVYTNSPKQNYNTKIAGQDRKRYTDKAAAMKYIEGRKKAYANLFTEISPPIPPAYAHQFMVNDVLLPGYTITGYEPPVSTKTADEIISEILGGDSLSADKKPSVLKKLAEGKKDKSSPIKAEKKKEEQSL